MEALQAWLKLKRTMIFAGEVGITFTDGYYANPISGVLLFYDMTEG